MGDFGKLLDNAERIATIGSPSSTSELALDILGTAVDKKLVGELAFFDFNQDGKRHYALGQITEIQLRNAWLEDPTMRSLARQKGQISQISGRQDIHLGQMTVSAVFGDEGDKFLPSILGTVPPTGTFVKLVTDDILNKLLERYKEEIFYLGYVYGSTPKLPLWFKDFSSGPYGAGEAYHIGIFGKTGSGKSVLAKMILLAYARYEDMGIFVLDPQGEFALSLRNEQGENMSYVLNRTILEKLNKECIIYDLSTLKLDRWELFVELLREFKFFFELGIKSSEYQGIVAEDVLEFLRKDENIKLKDLDKNAFVKTLQYIHQNIDKIYADKTGVMRVRSTVEKTLDEIRNNSIPNIFEKWRKVSQFFQGNSKKSPGQIVNESLYPEKRPLIIIDLSQKPEDVEQDVWDRKIKPLLIDRFLEAITEMAALVYHRKEKEQMQKKEYRKTNLNTLVLIDEAHRLAPREKQTDERMEKIKNRLMDAARTTRKYGLGWMFISQTLSSLHKEIIGQLRIFFFGFGLALGNEFQALREIVGGDTNALKLYQSFRDPHSSFDISSRQYAFMTVGPVSPLSFAGSPLFFTAFNTPEEFLRANNFI